ncbi:MAG: FecR domain-containing protein, partial [Ruminiclostridium sp.]|nr:FecR domain-containing protein [Ruminiclostridium sp.]
MGVGKLLKTTKGKIITAIVALVAVAAIVAVILLLINGNTYRSIIAKSVSGTVNVVGEINNGPAYSGERLYGGDDVSVMEASSLTMLMDNDKYLYAAENTHFVLKAEQSGSFSRIRIVLDKGSALNELRSSLNINDSYDVDTPNSTMSVRGTKFTVTVFSEGDIVYTLLEVSEGVVLAQLRTLDGVYTGVEAKFTAGESVLIRGGKDFSEFVTDENGETVRHLGGISSLPPEGTERLKALLDMIRDTEHTPAATSAVTDIPEPPVTEGTTAVTTEVTTVTTTEITTVTTPETVPDITTVHTHVFGGWTVSTAAGCTEAGVEKRVCLGCGITESRMISALGHSFGDLVIKPSGCVTEGSEERVCSVCGKKERKTIAANGHKFGKWVNVEKADCEHDGLKTRTCSVCGKKERK